MDFNSPPAPHVQGKTPEMDNILPDVYFQASTAHSLKCDWLCS